MTTSQNSITDSMVVHGPTVTIIVGLPGSGKTQYALKNYFNWKLFDDVANNQELFDTFRDNISSGTESLVVTDTFLLTRKMRQQIEDRIKVINPLYQVIWILFENDPLQCFRNLKMRNDDRIISFDYILDCSIIYELDEASTIIPVYKPLVN